MLRRGAAPRGHRQAAHRRVRPQSAQRRQRQLSAARKSTSSRRASSSPRRAAIGADGPYPADTIFVRAKNGAFDGIVTMYHDQGQIAMKLMGFERGVTVQGGLPVAITTPAHGTAYDIAGKGHRQPAGVDERARHRRAHGRGGLRIRHAIVSRNFTIVVYRSVRASKESGKTPAKIATCGHRIARVRFLRCLVQR